MRVFGFSVFLPVERRGQTLVDFWSAFGLSSHVLPVESASCCYAVPDLFAFDFLVVQYFDRVVCVCAAVHTTLTFGFVRDLIGC